MSRLRRLLEPVNWLYALGELVLIILGIAIALWLNNWNEDRQSRRTELRVLREIRASLLLDLQSFDSAMEALRRNERGLRLVLDHLEGKPIEPDSLTRYYGLAYWNAGRPVVHTAAYETLRSRGLDLISSDSLRMQIARLFDERYTVVERSMASGDNSVIEVLRPYYLRHFRRLQPGHTATPIDDEALIRDPYFANIVSYRHLLVRDNLKPTFERARRQAAELADAIAREIERRE